MHHISFRRCGGSSIAIASSTRFEATTRPCSSQVYQASPTPDSAATSSRRSPGCAAGPSVADPPAAA